MGQRCPQLRIEQFQDSHDLFPLFDEFLYFHALGDKDMDGVRHWGCHGCCRQFNYGNFVGQSKIVTK